MKYIIVCFSIIILNSCSQNSGETGKNAPRTDNKGIIDDSSVSGNNKTSHFPLTITNGQLGDIRTGDSLKEAFEKLKDFRIVTDSISTCEGCETYAPIYKIYDSILDKLSFTIEPVISRYYYAKSINLLTQRENIHGIH